MHIAFRRHKTLTSPPKAVAPCEMFQLHRGCWKKPYGYATRFPPKTTLQLGETWGKGHLPENRFLECVTMSRRKVRDQHEHCPSPLVRLLYAAAFWASDWLLEFIHALASAITSTSSGSFEEKNFAEYPSLPLLRLFQLRLKLYS